MKATFEFDMNEPEDVMEHRRMSKALDMALVLWEIKHNAQKKIHDSLDYTEEDKPKTAHEAAELIFDMIYQLMEDYNINVDELIQ
jgi:1,4-alpha-glucan branching enzyme